MINSIHLKNFKKIHDFESELELINILIGSNNSGKSSILQGIHFSILAESKRRQLKRDTIPQEELLYVPASDFSVLRHGEPYTNYSGLTSELFLRECESDSDESFTITLSKGRNHGNISISTTPNNRFRQKVTTYKELYSAYTPGISGISVSEKLVSRAVLRNAAANGDANLYLRNIIYYISCDNKLSELNKLIQKVFINTIVKVSFDEYDDLFINVSIKTNDKVIPIELCGTGLLQVIQIMAYVVYFQPKLLLLDEPDEHLHPDNQLLLCAALKLISQEYGTQMIISTHSRYIISSMEYEAKMIWIKDGSVNHSECTNNMYDILLDLGALDTYDSILQGKYTTVILTEDSDLKYLRLLLAASGHDLSKTLLIPYNSCSKLDAAILLSSYLKRSAPACKCIIHRDRDFMTDDEVNLITDKITKEGIIPWITDESDIEAYFTSNSHIAFLTQKTEEEVDLWINKILQENHVEIQHKFESKRNDIRTMMYIDGQLKNNTQIQCPSFESLFGKTCPTNRKNVIGKYLLKKINGNMFEFAGHTIDVLTNSPALKVSSLTKLH